MIYLLKYDLNTNVSCQTIKFQLLINNIISKSRHYLHILWFVSFNCFAMDVFLFELSLKLKVNYKKVF